MYLKKVSIWTTVIVMAMGLMMAGCDDSKKASDQAEDTKRIVQKPGEGTTAGASDELPPTEWGFICWGYTDQLGASYKSYLEHLAPEFNATWTFLEGYATEDVAVAYDTLVQQGVDGILSIFITPNGLKQCEEAGILLGMYCNSVGDPELLAACNESDVWVGANTENDFECGKVMLGSLYEKGCRKVLALAPPPMGGDGNHDRRWNGIMEKKEEYRDLEVIEYRGSTFDDAVRNALALHPDIDGIVLTGGANGNTDVVIQTLVSEGKAGDIKFATLDINEGSYFAFEEDQLHFIGGGQYPDPAIMWIVMLNRALGTPLAGEPVYLESNFIFIESVDDFDNYIKYVEGEGYPYTADELKEHVKYLNPDATYEALDEMWSNYSLEDVVARRTE